MTEDVLKQLRAEDPAADMPPADAARREALREAIAAGQGEPIAIALPRRARRRVVFAVAVAAALLFGAGVVYALATGSTPSLPGFLSPRERQGPAPAHSASPTPEPPTAPAGGGTTVSSPTSSPRPSRSKTAGPSAPSTGGWSVQRTGTRADWTDVCFVDGERGWAVAGHGPIVATTDGGASWVTQKSDTTTWLSAIAFADTDHGWIVGRYGRVIATDDGGADWTSHDSGTTADLWDVAAMGTTRAIAVGDGGTALVTTDGGATWTPLDVGTTTDLVAVAALGADRVWVLTEDAAVLATRDGGATWTRTPLRTSARMTKMVFADADHGWVAAVSGGGMYGTRALLFATTDGGATWSRRCTGGKASDLVDIAFSDALHGWAVARRFDDVFDPIMETTDGGATWTLRGVTRRPLAAITCFGTMRGWAVGDQGVIVATTNGGVSSDSTPPVTEARGAAGWHGRNVLVRFRMTDRGGSGAVLTMSRDEDGWYWRRGPSAWVMARRNHSNDGVNVIYVRSVDAAGNVEKARAIKVRVDTRAPKVLTPYPATVDAGGVGHVTFKITDQRPCAGWADATMVAGGTPELDEAVLARFSRLRTGVWHTLEFEPAYPLKAGTYRFSIWATDAAGNGGGGPTNTLTVR